MSKTVALDVKKELGSVIDIVALGGFHLLLEVGDAGLDKDVIPLNELLDVAAMNTLAVEVGQHVAEILKELVSLGFLNVDGRGLTLFQGLQTVKDIHQRHVVAVGEHGDI